MRENKLIYTSETTVDYVSAIPEDGKIIIRFCPSMKIELSEDASMNLARQIIQALEHERGRGV